MPAITRPSASVAVSGASPSEPGPNRSAKPRMGEDRADLGDDVFPLRRRGDARRALEPGEGAVERRSAGATGASRSSSWWISEPRRAAARIA